MNRIKTVIILTTVLFSGAFFTSCDSDDDNDQPSSIVGTWKNVSETTEEFTNNVSIDMSSETIDDKNFIRLTFNADNTFTEFTSRSAMENGMEVILTSTDNGTYEINDTKLSMTYGIDTEMLDFTLTHDQLVIVETEEYTSSSNDAKKFITTITYSKQ